MKLRILFAAALFLTGLTTSQANITSISYTDDGDGAVKCPIYTWPGGTDVSIYGDQYWGPGHVLFDIVTDSSGDPTLTLANAIENDTAFAWTGYEVDISMNKTFTFSGQTVTLPGDWTVSSVVQPGAPIGGIYTGQLFFTAGTPVPVGGELDFAFKLTFLGSAQFTEQLVPVPEPGVFSLLLGGLLLVGRRAMKRR